MVRPEQGLSQRLHSPRKRAQSKISNMAEMGGPMGAGPSIEALFLDYPMARNLRRYEEPFEEDPLGKILGAC